MKAILVRAFGGLFLGAALFAAPIDIFNTTGSFTSYTNNNDGQPFWDRNSSDGTNCNVGFYLNSNAMNCVNEKMGTPNNQGLNLALANTQSLNAGDAAQSNVNWTIDGGDYAFRLVGSITGASEYEVGIKQGGTYTMLFDDDTDTFGNIDPRSIVGPFELYIKSDGREFSSNDGALRVAAFYNSDTNLYYFGFEDRGACQAAILAVCERESSDFDYNDVVISMEVGGRVIEEVPEPSTYALLGGGLLAMGIYRRRRG